MSTLHKVKAYFGMAPMDDYDDEYYEDDDRVRPRDVPAARATSGSRTRVTAARLSTTGRPAASTTSPGGYRGGYDEPRFEARLRGPA